MTHHDRDWLSGEHETRNQLGNQIDRHELNACGVENGSREEVDKSEKESDDVFPDGEVGLKHLDANDGETKEDEEKRAVPPIGSLGVGLHELVMDIRYFRLDVSDTSP